MFRIFENYSKLRNETAETLAAGGIFVSHF
jgi:hypothetical protein